MRVRYDDHYTQHTTARSTESYCIYITHILMCTLFLYRCLSSLWGAKQQKKRKKHVYWLTEGKGGTGRQKTKKNHAGTMQMSSWMTGMEEKRYKETKRREGRVGQWQSKRSEVGMGKSMRRWYTAHLNDSRLGHTVTDTEIMFHN